MVVNGVLNNLPGCIIFVTQLLNKKLSLLRRIIDLRKLLYFVAMASEYC